MSRRPKKEEISDREYPITLYRADEGGFVAEHRDLPGCLTQGETLEEALENLTSARTLWIATALGHGDEVPIPANDERFGGRVLVRMPKSLHRRLLEEADQDGVSLNHFIVTRLAERVRTSGLETRMEAMERSLAHLGRQVATIASAAHRPPKQPHESLDLPSPSEMAELNEALLGLTSLGSMVGTGRPEQWTTHESARAQARVAPRSN